MEELKILIEAVANLPNAALWVLSGYLFYKVTIIGSIYGVIRFAIDKLHNWATIKKSEVTPVNLCTQIGCITEGVATSLIAQLLRVKDSTSSYLHASDVANLAKAIDLMQKKN